MSQSLGRITRWLRHTMDADQRYICAACDDRFADRTDGVAHVARCHPEYAEVLANEAIDPGRRLPCPTRTVVVLKPAAGWS